jgi:tripartite-type tricarboxylate transporter receptor subunit TctC
MMVLGPSLSSGQDYPNKPIRVVTSGIGGGNDIAARIIAQGLVAAWGQQVIVDNRPSAFHGMYLPNAAPDGYNLLMGGESIWISPLLQKMPYDALRDFNPVVLIGHVFNVLVVHPATPVKSVKELIDLAKSKPGQLNYSASTQGGSAHLATELFKSMAGVDIVYIPHKTTPEAIISLLGGQGAQLAFFSIPSIAPHIRSGKLRAVAVTSVKPSALVPELPTVAATVPGYQSGGQIALFAPPKTPAAIIGQLNREVVRYLNTPEIKEKFANSGVDIAAGSPDELRAFVKADTARWAKVIKDAGIKIQ